MKWRVSVLIELDNYEEAKSCFDNLEDAMVEEESIITIAINREDDNDGST